MWRWCRSLTADDNTNRFHNFKSNIFFTIAVILNVVERIAVIAVIITAIGAT